MSGTVILEDLSVLRPGGNASRAQCDAELARDEGYAVGLIAGETAARDGAHQRLSETLDHAAFTYHEARAALISELAPALQEMVTAVLPALARSAFPAHVEEMLTALPANLLTDAITIRLPPDLVDVCEDVVGRSALDIRIIGDPDLAPLQAHLCTASAGHCFDAGAVIGEITEAVDAIIHDARPSKESLRP